MLGVRLVEVGLAGGAVRVGVGDAREDFAHRGRLRRGETVGEDAREAERGHRNERPGGEGERPAGTGEAAAAERALDEGPGRPGEQEREAAEREQRRGRQRVAEAEAGEGQDRLVPEVGRVGDEPDPDRRGVRQQARGGGAGDGEADEEAGAGDGEHDGKDAGKPRRERDRRPDQHEAGGGGEAARPAGRCREHDEAADRELPGAEGQEEEARLRVALRGPDGDGEADRGEERERGGGAAAAPAPEQREERGEEQVELLLDAEAPGVQQRQVIGGGTEVVEDAPEPEVRDREHGGEKARREARELRGRHPGDRKGDAGEKNDHERRQDAAGAALVEAGDREAPLGELAREDAGDEVARDHEEDVDAEPAAGEGREAGVKQHHRQHRDRAQAVDLAAIAVRRRRYGGAGRAGDLDRLGQPGLRRCWTNMRDTHRRRNLAAGGAWAKVENRLTRKNLSD